MGDTDVQRLRDAKSHIEAQLLENLKYLTCSELKTYIKCDDEVKAFHMIKKYLNCHNISNDDIRFQCGLIGNTLHHRSRDWAKNSTYQPKRITRQSTSTMSSHDLVTKTSSPSATPLKWRFNWQLDLLTVDRDQWADWWGLSCFKWPKPVTDDHRQVATQYVSCSWIICSVRPGRNLLLSGL